MIRVLVPIDFSGASHAAFCYAYNFARKISAEITVIHIINGSFITSDTMFLDTMDTAFESALQRIRKYVQDTVMETGETENEVLIKTEVRFGVPGFAISDFANDKLYDYVITGMRDSHSMIERFLGTTSTIVTKQTHCPVILIHENTKWRSPEKIIFTVDNNTDFDESIDRFKSFNQYFKASTDFIHISIQNEPLDHTKEVLIKEVFKHNEPDFPFEIKSISGGDIVQSIVDYSIFEKADMLIMVHRKRSFLESFFNRSMSLRTAEGIHLPIMVLEENISS